QSVQVGRESGSARELFISVVQFQNQARGQELFVVLAGEPFCPYLRSIPVVQLRGEVRRFEIEQGTPGHPFRKRLASSRHLSDSPYASQNREADDRSDF